MKAKIALSFLLCFSFARIFAQSPDTVRVIFHIVWKTAPQNIPDSVLQDQLDVLNEDLNAQNADLWKVPPAWVPIIGDLNVRFEFAQIDPSGNPTTGVERFQTATTSWTTNDNVKYSAMGGMNAWPDTSYLNIWVCNLSGGLMSYAQEPGGNSATDGIVLHYQATGRGAYCMSPFNLGRNGTHSVGHWLGLRHFGPSVACADIDNIPDTPPFDAATIYGGFNPFQVVTDNCNPTAPGVMWMNYMTYVDDSSMYFFTQAQTDTMDYYLNLRLGNTSTGINSLKNNTQISVFPNPSADGNFTIVRNSSMELAVLSVCNMLGEQMIAPTIVVAGQNKTVLNLSSLANGIYTVQLREGNQISSVRICIAH
jgi:hypothetical protein